MIGVDLFLVLVVLTNLRLLAATRLGASVRVAAAQGLLLGFLTLALHAGDLDARVATLAVLSTAIKAGVFPWLLFRAMGRAHISRDLEPLVGSGVSMILALVALGASFWLGGRLPLPHAVASPLLVPAALFSIISGLFLLVNRRKAVSQVIGFIVLENGVFTFGIGVMEHTSLLVEAGVLLDVFVAVFVMGIAIFNIGREFDDIDTERLSALKDYEE